CRKTLQLSLITDGRNGATYWSCAVSVFGTRLARRSGPPKVGANKGTLTMRFSTLTGAALALSLAAGAAMAGPITGTINLNGVSNFDGTAVTFTNPANVGAVSGDFSALGTCLSCVTMTTPWTY